MRRSAWRSRYGSEYLNLNPAVDRSFFQFISMIHQCFLRHLTLTFMVSPLRGGFHVFCGTWLRCNSLEWNGHSASLRLALHLKNHALHPVQLPDLG